MHWVPIYTSLSTEIAYIFKRFADSKFPFDSIGVIKTLHTLV